MPLVGGAVQDLRPYEMEDHHVKAKKEVAKRRKLASGQKYAQP